MMSVLVGLGLLVSVALLVPLFRGPLDVVDGGHYLAYRLSLVFGGHLTALYVVTTCGGLLASTDPYIRWFGVINLVAVASLTIFLSAGVISLWCVWAAVSSLVVTRHIREQSTKSYRERSAATAGG